ncbi:phosphoglucosamine mutase [bacterium]
MKRKFFGTDGVRAVAGKYPLDEKTIQQLGYSAGSVFKKTKGEDLDKKVVIGSDTRESAFWIFKALCKGFNRCGINIDFAGVIPTPCISVLSRREEYMCGVVISASHNPYYDNGIKFFSSAGEKLPDEIELEIEKNLNNIRLDNISENESYADISDTAHKIYTDFLKNTLPDNFRLKNLKIIVDCANGALSKIAPKFLESLGANVIPLASEPNGKNINENCGSTHISNLTEKVKEKKANLGIAFDGDGDRVILVDDKAQVVDGDFVMGILAKNWKEKNELVSDTLVLTVMSNLGLKIAMKNLGIKTEETQVGDRYVYERMKEKNLILGGEQSGHIILRDYNTTGDGLLTALHLLKVIIQTNKNLSELKTIFDKFPQVLVNVKVKEKKDVMKIPALKEEYEKIRDFLNEEGRILIRYSGTEPLLRIMIEGRDKNIIEDMANKYAEMVKKNLS